MSDKLILEEISANVREIKTQMLELIKQGAIHNTILQEHEKRSTNLETRLEPIEKDYSFRHKLYAILMSSGAIGILAHFLLK